MGRAADDALGRYGEQLAERWLTERGLVLLDRNWRLAAGPLRGELDLVLRDRDAIVFAEVKTRSSLRYGLPAEALSPTKAARIRRLATAWLAAHDYPYLPVRFDVVAIVRARTGAVQVEHLVGAF